MKFKAVSPLSNQVPSNTWIVFVSLMCGASVTGVAIALQWLIYDDWMHRSGFRLVGTLLAGVLTFAFAHHWQSVARRRKIEMLRRFETIALMNDRIRNELQIIECATYATNPKATEPVRNAVDVIESVLEEVLADVHPASRTAPDDQVRTPPPQGATGADEARSRNAARSLTASSEWPR